MDELPCSLELSTLRLALKFILILINTRNYIHTYFPILTRNHLETHSHTDIRFSTHTLSQIPIKTYIYIDIRNCTQTQNQIHIHVLDHTHTYSCSCSYTLTHSHSVIQTLTQINFSNHTFTQTYK